MYNVGEEVVALKNYSDSIISEPIVKDKIYTISYIDKCVNCGVVSLCVGITIKFLFTHESCLDCGARQQAKTNYACFDPELFAPLSSLYRTADAADIAEALQSTKVLQPQTA